MKRVLILPILLALLLIWGCGDNAAERIDPSQTDPSLSQELMALPQELLGVWVSADEGERDMVETISFFEDNSLTVELKYQGENYGMLYGYCTIEGHRLTCHIQEGASPYTVEYEFRIDGRMLILTDDDGPAEYLRTS